MLEITSDMKTRTCKMLADCSIAQALTEFSMAAIALQSSFQRENPALGKAVTHWLTSDMEGSFRDQMAMILVKGTGEETIVVDFSALKGQAQEAEDDD